MGSAQLAEVVPCTGDVQRHLEQHLQCFEVVPCYLSMGKCYTCSPDIANYSGSIAIMYIMRLAGH